MENSGLSAMELSEVVEELDECVSVRRGYSDSRAVHRRVAEIVEENAGFHDHHMTSPSTPRSDSMLLYRYRRTGSASAVAAAMSRRIRTAGGSGAVVEDEYESVVRSRNPLSSDNSSVFCSPDFVRARDSGSFLRCRRSSSSSSGDMFNPFEQQMLEQIGRSFVSSAMFSEVVSPGEEVVSFTLFRT